MSKAFFFHHAVGGIFPATAISGLRGENRFGWDRLCHSLIGVSGGEGYARSINLYGNALGGPGGDAVLMMGTTPELQAEVQAAIADGVNGVYVKDDYLVIYYLRYAERGTFTSTDRTVACIAGWKHYWGLSLDSNDDSNVQNSGWALLYPNGGTDQWIFNDSMSLQTLNQVLGRLHHAESWYNERGQLIR